ncbi:ester cyclase [Pseudomonas sp. Ps21-P2]|uniref:ester cyclase n=1 Tax=Pseudomonas sp. Ps21-P2 TaxID=3080331 RepID=UPI003208F883
MDHQTLKDAYTGYITCLNRQDWAALGDFVGEDVHYNGERVGLAGYRQMLERDFRAIPDLRFVIDLLIAEPPHIAARLTFDCTPVGELFEVAVNGRRVQFTENVFYTFEAGRIVNVASVIDKATVAAQVPKP